MRKIFLLFALVGFMGSLQAQSPSKMVKKATRLFGSYRLDPGSNGAKLDEAKTLVMDAFNDQEIQNDVKANQAKGDILAEVAQRQINAAILDPAKAENIDYDVVGEAISSLENAYNLADKKYQKKDALKSLSNIEQIVENAGIIALQNQKNQEGFDLFKQLLEVSNFLKKNGEETALDLDVVNQEGVSYPKKNDIVKYALNAGVQPGVEADVMPLLTMAKEQNIQDPTIYQIAYMHYKDSDKDKAVDYLNQGREMFPDDSGLLFAEINKYIEDEDLEGLIGKLKLAIEKEPDNASVYSTLGNVYDQLFTKASAEDGDHSKSEEYFQGALDNYNRAIELDANNFGSYYGIGALYFNKAAAVAKEMNANSSDMSAAGQAKYTELEGQMKGYYEQSFPYLQKAEELEPTDPLVLTAMREYYVRLGDFDKANEYKAKLEGRK